MNVTYLYQEKHKNRTIRVSIRILLALTNDEWHLCLMNHSSSPELLLTYDKDIKYVELGCIWMNRQLLMVGKGGEDGGDDGEWWWNDGEWWWDGVLSINITLGVGRELRRQWDRLLEKGKIKYI